MNLAASLRDVWASPAAAFLSFPDTSGYVDDEALSSCDDHPLQVDPVQWRMDGSTSFGTSYFATPYTPSGALSSLAPTAIAVQIPDQLKWPPALRAPLDASKSAHMMDVRSKSLGITRHLRYALENWSNRMPDFSDTYLRLPYGSTIEVKNISADVTDMVIVFVPKPGVVRQMLTLSQLQVMWKFPAEVLPETIALDSLRLELQLEKSIMLVALPECLGGARVIFKTRLGTLRSLYHEIKALCTIPPHPTIIKKPLYLVSTCCPETNHKKICGFLLEYHEKGALQEILPQRMLNGSLPLEHQLSWAIQLTTALVHIKESSDGQFYSDLKMDNILISSCGGTESVVLADFEQGRNIFACAPPESYLIDWLYELADTPSIGQQRQDQFADLLRSYLAQRKLPSPMDLDSSIYDNAPYGYYYPWLALTHEEREAGMVFMLGKALWCIFEGVGQVCNIIGRSARFETRLEFPEFRATPEPLRELIKSCTSGAREWSTGPLAVYRNGSKIYPRGKTGTDGQPRATIEETKVVIKETWEAEVNSIVAFVNAKNRQLHGESTSDDMKYLEQFHRPRLRKVLESLQAFEHTREQKGLLQCVIS